MTRLSRPNVVRAAARVLAAAAILAGVLSTAVAAAPRASRVLDGAPGNVVSRAAGGAGLAEGDLHSQLTGMRGFGVLSQEVTDLAQFTSFAYDDFTVPPGGNWSVDGFSVQGSFLEGLQHLAESYSFAIYPNVNGLPACGAPLFSVTVPRGTPGLAVDPFGDFSYRPGRELLVLGEGTYWFSAWVRMPVELGWFYWAPSAEPHVNGSESAFDNPGGGWDGYARCALDADVDWDLAFALHGRAVRPEILSVGLREPENRTAHHTNWFRTTERLLLRRGQVVRIDVKLSSPYDPARHAILIEASHVFDGPRATIRVPEAAGPVPPADRWAVFAPAPIVNADRTKTVRLLLNLAPDAAIGEYDFQALVGDRGFVEPASRRDFPKGVAIFFNPWSPLDEVFMNSERARNEYVCNMAGRLWLAGGTMSWRYSQFDASSLRVLLDLLKTPAGDLGPAALGSAERRSAALVARRLSAQANVNDGRGILEGRWNGRYAGGTNPGRWSGSDSIINRYLATGAAPVRYGQCWVFGGLLTTLLRTAGIPARPITNYNSAHNRPVPADRTIQLYFDAFGRFDKNRTTDSIWNFHVWCDAWMKRPDRPGHDGWQAVDGTPQEKSDGLSQMGPAPHAAIRAKTGGATDVDFVTDEVDADVELRDFNGIVRWIDRTWVGRSISTKAVGNGSRVDITSLYKAALTLDAGPDGGGGDVAFTPTRDETVAAGAPLVTSLRMTNESAAGRNVHVVIAASAVAYDGSFIGDVDDVDVDLTLPAGVEDDVVLSIPVAAYAPWLALTRTFSVSVFAEVAETSDVFMDMKMTAVTGPDAAVSFSPAAVVETGRAVECRIDFTNVLPIDVHSAVFAISCGESLSIEGSQEVEVAVGTIGAGDSVSFTRDVTGLELGRHPVSVTLVADELTEVHGSGELHVVNDRFAGNVNAVAGPPADVVFVNGSAGVGPDRRVTVAPSDPFSIRIDAPPSNPDGPAPYLLCVWIRAPRDGDERLLPKDIGMTAMPLPLHAPAGPQPKKIANTMGRTSLLGVPNWPTGATTAPAPTTLLDLPRGLRRAGTFFLQGLILDAGSPTGIAAVTNGITVVSE